MRGLHGVVYEETVMKMLVTAFNRDADRLAALERMHPGIQFVLPEDRKQAPQLMDDVDALFGQLTPDEYAQSTQLRWVQSSSAGVEWIARVPGLVDSDIVITNMRGAHAATIAEHTFAMLLALTRTLPGFAAHQQSHEWGRGEVGVGMRGIKGLTMGIVGFGNIGRAIARRATGFEMRVLAVDAEEVPPGEGVQEVWPLSRLNELCEQSDVLTISAPITPRSRGMIGREQVGLLRRGSYILQVSRGAIVDEPALVDALEEGHLQGAGLDVTATEPLPVGDPLWTAPNTIITPHTSAYSDLTMQLVYEILSENVGRFVRGEPLMNMVDKRRGY
jgi:phosphoglycerate dehydrogenase-like enzyme